MNKFNSENMNTLNPKLRSMEVGDSVAYPIKRLFAVRSACSIMGSVLNRKYTSKINRDDRTVTVTRVD